MNISGEVARYVDALAFARAERRQDWSWGRTPFVTISRQAGAGGHAVAQAVLEDFSKRGDRDLFGGWKLFDKAVIELLSGEPSFRDALHALLNEDYYGGAGDFFRQLVLGDAPRDLILSRVFECLRSLAGIGKVVILGRAGACATARLPAGVHVRLVAARPTRLAAMRRLWRVEPAAAQRRLHELERSRAAVVRAHFAKDVADPLLYDAVFNTDRVSPKEIAAWIAERVEEKAQASQRAASSA